MYPRGIGYRPRQDTDQIRLNTLNRAFRMAYERLDEFDCRDMESKDIIDLLFTVDTEFHREGFQE